MYKQKMSLSQKYEDMKTIFCIINGTLETIIFDPEDITDLEVEDLFIMAAEACPHDILRLHKKNLSYKITSSISANTPEDPYHLQVISFYSSSSDNYEAEILLLVKRIKKIESEILRFQEAHFTSNYMLRVLKQKLSNLKHKISESALFRSKQGLNNNLSSIKWIAKIFETAKLPSTKHDRMYPNPFNRSVSRKLREGLKSPEFDARQWQDQDLLLFLKVMFTELGLMNQFKINITKLHSFLIKVYDSYNDVPFHNFRHCFCVAQMMYVIIWAVDLISKLGELEVLILMVSCICHDLDHPGYNNIYQINAHTELALRYNDISPLENHHCSVAFYLMEKKECNIFSSFDSDDYKIIREGIIRCILATDMARHNEILAEFNEIVSSFDYTSKSHTNLLSMVLIKVADISNEARPMEVAEPWLDNLLQEFFQQSDAEKLSGLPVTPFMDREKVTKPSSQCGFIGLVLLPLFSTLCELFPELLEILVKPVHFALDYYKHLNEIEKEELNTGTHLKDLKQKSKNNLSDDRCTNGLTKKDASSSSVLLVESSSFDLDIFINSQINTIATEKNYSIMSNSETETEVDVSEKTTKFKISMDENTCNPIFGRKSHPNSRKGSRDDTFKVSKKK